MGGVGGFGGVGRMEWGMGYMEVVMGDGMGGWVVWGMGGGFLLS